jgi:glycosidase
MKKLELLKNKLNELSDAKENPLCYIPSILNNPNIQCKAVAYPFVSFILDSISKIEKIALSQKVIEKNWQCNAVIYNLFVRFGAAFCDFANYNQSSESTLGFRHNGTFCKAIALLPYLHNMGVNTIYLLPVTSIGKYNKKGDAGSPFAIKNHYKLDENLSEPALGLGPERELAAFVEAAHAIGMKVVLEFVFRTSSIDSDLALIHPEWFYWIKEESIVNEDVSHLKYSPPFFNDETLALIRSKIENQDFTELPTPDFTYINLFTDTPEKVFSEKGKIIGITKDGVRCTIPGAFADWPPDDNQPLWSDVTYLKLYEHPDFNYIAYNTVRMYDTRLAEEEFILKDLWEYLENIIPFYINKFDIDGVLIDMGHALPKQLLTNIIQKAKSLKNDFIFLEENFVATKESVDIGFNAVVGYLPFDLHIPWKVRNLINMYSSQTQYLPMFATAETHNTPRAASRFGKSEFNKLAFAFCCMIPAIPFIHNGFELGESIPVNTGLDFSSEVIQKFPADTLALFSHKRLNWLNANYCNDIRDLLKVRTLHAKFITNSLNKIQLFELDIDNVISFYYRFLEKNQVLFFLGNFSETDVQLSKELPFKYISYNVLYSNCSLLALKETLSLSLKAFEFCIIEFQILSSSL